MAAVIVQVKKSKTATNGENISAGPTGVARPFVDDEINEVRLNFEKGPEFQGLEILILIFPQVKMSAWIIEIFN